MTTTTILTDSTTYLPPAILAKFNIQVVPLMVHWGEDSFRDGIDITPSVFYEKLSRRKEIPTTSQPSQEKFAQIFSALAEHSDGIVAPLISSGISGTVANAQAVAREFKQIPIEIIDTRNTSVGQALVVMEAANVAFQGGTLQEIRQAAEVVVEGLHTFFVVDTLKYLHRGGRIGGASRYLGTALNIKPILCLNSNGKIDALERVRTKHKALQRLISLAEERSAGKPVKMGVMHANAPQVAKEFCDQITRHVECKELITVELSPVIGTHVGPGTIGIAFYPIQEGQ